MVENDGAKWIEISKTNIPQQRSPSPTNKLKYEYRPKVSYEVTGLPTVLEESHIDFEFLPWTETIMKALDKFATLFDNMKPIRYKS